MIEKSLLLGVGLKGIGLKLPRVQIISHTSASELLTPSSGDTQSGLAQARYLMNCTMGLKKCVVSVLLLHIVSACLPVATRTTQESSPYN